MQKPHKTLPISGKYIYFCNGSGGTETKVWDVYITADYEGRDKVLQGTYVDVESGYYEFTDDSEEGWGKHNLLIIELPSANGIFDPIDLADILGEYIDDGTTFGNFYIDGHGWYEEPAFDLGDDKITEGNLNRTSVLKPFFNGHNVFILSCDVGGGQYPNRSLTFVQNASNLWGATVFANRSLTRGGNPFDGTPLSHANPSNTTDQENQVRFAGQWLMAKPNGTPEIINSSCHL